MARTPRDPKTVPAGKKSAATKCACIVAPAGPERARIIDMLDGWGIETLAVESPLESAAIIYQRCAQGEHFDLILFSPDGHGVDAKHYGRLIRSDQCAAKTPLVHVGEVDHVGERGHIRCAGFVDFLSDTADKGEIFEVIQEAIAAGGASTANTPMWCPWRRDDPCGRGTRSRSECWWQRPAWITKGAPEVRFTPVSLLQNSAAAAADKWECFASPDCRARACACRQRNVRIAGNRNIDHRILRKVARGTASAPGVAPALGCGSD